MARAAIIDTSSSRWANGAGSNSPSSQEQTYIKPFQEKVSNNIAMTVEEFQTILKLETKRRKSGLKRKSCLRRDVAPRSNGNQAASTSSSSKSVRFATNAKSKTNQVWCTIREFQKAPKKLHTHLWLTSEEKYQRYENDMDLVDEIEEGYFEALIPAFNPIHKHSPKVHLDMDHLMEYSDARGLESEVLREVMSSTVRRHCRAVLKAQAGLQQSFEENEEGSTESAGNSNFPATLSPYEDSKWSHVRAQSLKHSTRSALIANKMADYDRECVILDMLDTSSQSCDLDEDDIWQDSCDHVDDETTLHLDDDFLHEATLCDSENMTE